jgi:hypothetical protein
LIFGTCQTAVSIDGKHICIKCFPKSGSLYFNYKGYILVVLLACADANALFTTVHVRGFSKNSDGSVFRASTLGQMLEKEELHIPFPTSLPMDDSDETFPYYFAADKLFTLKINLMRPNSGRMPTNKRHIFNYRLSHARKSVECAFGILNAKFKISEGPICCKETVNSIVKASVVLHNFIRTQEGMFCGGEKFTVNQSSHHILNEEDDGRQRLLRAQLLRNQLADYFLTPAGAISSQWSYVS